MILCASVTAFCQSVSPELFDGLQWRLIGPFRGGRAVAVAGVTGDSTKFYFGGVDGGVWKTTDAGVVWKPIFDGQPIASIGALAVAPSDPNIIYAGTGESDIRSDLSSGNGMYKSADGGRTWTHIGLEDTRQISRIAADPRDAQTVYVGALGHAYGPNGERGVYKSTDGGTHWTKVLDQGPEIGVADLAICAGHPDLLLRRPGMRTGRRGVHTRRLMGQAAGFIGRRTEERVGRVFKEMDYPKAIGDGQEWMLRRTGVAFTR